MAVKLEIEGFKSLNEQLGEAEDRVRNLVNQFGVGSQEVQKAAQEAGKLKQQMMEADRAIESFTSAGRFDAVAGGIQGIVGGFAAVQGAMAVVGVESEALEGTLLKVQGALALVEGVKGVTEFAKSFSTLKTVAVSAFNGIKAAIGSTGIGLLIVGLGLAIQQLIEYFGELNDVEVKNKTNLDNLTDSYKKFSDAVNQANADLERTTNIAVAQAELEGKSIEQVAEIRKQASLEQSQNILSQLTTLQATSKERIELAGKVAKAEGKDVAEATKTATAEIKAENERLNEELRKLDADRTLADIGLKKAQKDRDTKAVEDRKKTLADQKKLELDALKSLEEAKRQLAEERENDEIKLAELKFKNDLVRLKEARDEELKQENLTAKARQAIEKRYQVDAVTRNQQFSEEIEKLNKDREKTLADNAKAHTDKLIAEDQRRFDRSKQVVDDFFSYQQLDLENSLLSEEDYSKQSEAIELKRLERQLELAEKAGQDTVALELQIAQKKRAIRQRDQDEEEAKQQAILDFTFQTLNSIATTQEMFLNNRLNNERAAITNGFKEELESAETTAERRGEIEYQMALAMEELNEEQFQNEKKLSIVRATISGIESAINAYKAGAIFGPQTAAIFAAISLAFTGAQIAAISQQNYVPSIIREPADAGGSGRGSQYQEGGLLFGPSHDMGGVRTTLGELEGGEFVMNRRSTASFLPLLEQMNSMGNEGGPQLAQAQATPVVKAYVVATEMTSQQEANARIGRLARL